MEDEEYKKLPIEERCVHKLWKARVNGYEEVKKLFQQIDDEKSPEFGKYLGLVKKFVTDSNAMGQEKGLEATLAYVENYALAHRTVSEVMSGVVTKCIAAPKTRTRELALQLTLMYIEIEKQEAVIEELTKGMEQKNPKITAACISACTLALREFGSKIVNVKPLVKKISVLFADRDKSVRDEGRLMVVEIYRWIGPALRPQLTNLQPVQLTELETEFTKIDGKKAVPIRYVRSQQQKQAIVAAECDDVDAGASEEGEEVNDANVQLDPYELADPVDILSKLPKDFFEKIEAKKWQDRKEALEIVENLVKTPKLQNGEYGDLVRALKKIIEKDSNVIVVAMAGRCIAGLANGLKKRFQTYSGACISPILEKFKEKKQNVVAAMKEAIDVVYMTTNLEAILDDILEVLGNKNPSVKAETSFFLARAFSKTPTTVFNKKLLKALTTALLKVINEPDPTVRDAAAEALGTLMKLVGEKAIGPFLVELEKDNLKMSKIKECAEKAVITTKVVGGKKERPATAPAKAGSKVIKPSASSSSSLTAAAPKSAPNTNRAAPARKKPAGASRPKSKTSNKAPLKAVERELSDEEAEEVAAAILSGNVIKELGDSNWKTRLSACEQMLKDVQGLDGKEIPTQAIVRLVSKKPGLKDTNFQVLKAKLEIVKYVAENGTVSTTTVGNCINEITEKFSDSKNGSLVGETISALAEATTFSFVSVAVIDFAIGQKSPKVIQESLNWMAAAVKDFGFPIVHSKLFIENAKKALASTNPTVRQAAISFCGILYLYVGPPIYSFFETEKPALRDQINAECDKYEGEKPPPPTKGVVKSASTNSVDDLDEEEGGSGDADPPAPTLADLLPRIDISAQISDDLIAEIDDKSWKVRNEALVKVAAILQEAKFIKPSLGDLSMALARRLGDSNTKIAQSALNICDTIAKSMGAPCKQYIRVFFPCFIQNLGDNKSWMRATARETIDVYAKECGFKEFFENEMVADALKSGSPQLRIELWAWLAENLPKISPKYIPKEEVMACIPHLYTNLEDRNADVRKNAQEAMLGIMIHASYESMLRQTEKIKPSSKTVVCAILEKVRPNLPAKPLPKKAVSIDKDDKNIRGAKPAATTKNAVKTKNSAGSVKAAPATSAGRKKDDDVDTSPLLVANNLKNQRTIDESKMKVLKWNFTQPREEFVELLKDQMTVANVNRALITNMFHTDFRFHLKALEALTDDLSDNGPALISNLDLILKWLTLRFFDTNPSVLLKGLEYLHVVFNMLIETEYRIVENEASAFLPYLITKIGDPKDSVRNGVRALFKQIPNVYPISRFISYLMEGLKSKNARQRAECLEALDLFIGDYGLTILLPSSAVCLREIAKQISDRDNSVRNAALNCVVQAYFILGDKLYKMLGNISDKDLSLLEERIKRSNRRTSTKPLEVPLMSVAPRKSEEAPPKEQENVNETYAANDDYEDAVNLPPVIMPKMAEVSEPKGPFSLDEDLLNKLDQMKTTRPIFNIQEFDLDFLKDDVYIPKLSPSDMRSKIMPLSPPKPLDLNMTTISRQSLGSSNSKQPDPLLISSINKIASPDPTTVLHGIEEVSAFLTSNRASLMADYETEYLRAIVSQLRHLRLLDPIHDHNVVKLYRHILSILDLFYHVKRLGPNASSEVLKDIMDALITILVDGKLEHCQSGDAYIRVINLQCVKIIEKSDHTKIICALVKLMQESIREDTSPRLTELIMKCLWRIIKLMPTWGEEIEFQNVLLDVHWFLKEFPPSWWKNRPSDTALRTIKTILHTCVKIKGGSIVLYMGKIPNTSESEIETYLLKLLRTMNIEALKDAPLKPEPTRIALSRPIHIRLTEIFQKIGCKDETKEGLNLLYDFTQQHPEADVEPFLKKCSKIFQDYIQNGLHEIEKSRKVAKTSIEAKVAESIAPVTQASEPEESRGIEYWQEKLKKYQQCHEITDTN